MTSSDDAVSLSYTLSLHEVGTVAGSAKVKEKLQRGGGRLRGGGGGGVCVWGGVCVVIRKSGTGTGAEGGIAAPQPEDVQDTTHHSRNSGLRVLYTTALRLEARPTSHTMYGSE